MSSYSEQLSFTSKSPASSGTFLHASVSLTLQETTTAVHGVFFFYFFASPSWLGPAEFSRRLGTSAPSLFRILEILAIQALPLGVQGVLPAILSRYSPILGQASSPDWLLCPCSPCSTSTSRWMTAGKALVPW